MHIISLTCGRNDARAPQIHSELAENKPFTNIEKYTFSHGRPRGPALSLQTTNNLHPLVSLIRADVFSLYSRLYKVSKDLERRISIRISTCLPRYHIPGIWIYKAWTVSHSTKKISYLSSVPIPSTHFEKLRESFLEASKFLEANFVVSITVFV